MDSPNIYNGVERRAGLKYNGNLEQIRKLTASLSDTIVFKNDKFTELQSETEGKIMIWRLYADENIGIVRFLATAGSVHVEHCHVMNEFLFVSSGKLIAHMQNKDIEATQYEMVMIPAGVPHSIEYPEHTMGAAVTLPKDLAF
jgi:quercetin dioxygenase-like cupin family protein